LAPAQRNQLHGARRHVARNQDADWQAMKIAQAIKQLPQEM